MSAAFGFDLPEVPLLRRVSRRRPSRPGARPVARLHPRRPRGAQHRARPAGHDAGGTNRPCSSGSSSWAPTAPGRSCPTPRCWASSTTPGTPPPLARYLDLLASAGLLAGLQKYTGSRASRRASSPKLNVLNTALMTAGSGYSFREGAGGPHVLGPHRRERGGRAHCSTQPSPICACTTGGTGTTRSTSC